MLQLPLVFMVATAPTLPPKSIDDRTRFDACVALAASDPAASVNAALAWSTQGGRFFAKQCLGLAYAKQQKWPAAGAAFEGAAHEAEAANDDRAITYWQQAGNAWLIAGEPARARTALDAALAHPALTGFDRGETELDRARALFDTPDRAETRASLDRASVLAAEDPAVWLLSAKLARQAGDLARAKADIGQAMRRAADDASVQLEAGNIAAKAGDEAGAKTAWSEVVRLRPDSPQAKLAEAALAQFD